MRKWIDILTVAGIAVALYLVVNELIEPGYCPSYPYINIPACYLVLIFFILVFITRFIKKSALAKVLFFTSSFTGFATAVWFSSNHLLNRLECPVLINLPLCYAALLTFVLLLLLGFIGSIHLKNH